MKTTTVTVYIYVDYFDNEIAVDAKVERFVDGIGSHEWHGSLGNDYFDNIKLIDYQWDSRFYSPKVQEIVNNELEIKMFSDDVQVTLLQLAY